MNNFGQVTSQLFSHIESLNSFASFNSEFDSFDSFETSSQSSEDSESMEINPDDFMFYQSLTPHKRKRPPLNEVLEKLLKKKEYSKAEAILLKKIHQTPQILLLEKLISIYCL